MKKAIQILLIIILVLILSLIIVFVFNPFNSRTKLIGSIINSYLSGTIENYTSLDKAADTSTDSNVDSTTGASANTNTDSNDKHPLLNADQEKTLESYGVDVSQLPSSISAEMAACFVEKLGQARADEIVGGATPSALEIFKARACLGE